MNTSTAPETFTQADFTIEYGFAIKHRPKSSTRVIALPDALTEKRWFSTIQEAQKAARRSRTIVNDSYVIIQRAVTQPVILPE